MSTSLSLPAITATAACSSVYSVLSAQFPTPTEFKSQFAAASTNPCATIGLETVNPQAFLAWAADIQSILQRNEAYIKSASSVCSDFIASTSKADEARSSSCVATRAGASNRTVTPTTAPGTTSAPTTGTTSLPTTGTGQPATTTTGAPGAAGLSIRSSMGLLAGAVLAVGMLNI
ncbi:hypothetical protein MAPG_01313 [Magnaporthiopsis poae ATCC 64411]|uniref:Uncharacterized protein n=1 Tax=Magnaporthiopsis poae (strain ATCC 64411 / 73-15) TaxID=644358 RepID=A0A0C4DND3_MAGP6|nr:hypothetical protein MAPG_01313 [Magnaporthiopsis poae ATCC 64411]